MKNKTRLMILAAITIIAFSTTAFSWQSEKGYALIVEQSPPDTGVVTPNVGVHRRLLDEIVILQAIPKPGYKFVYWMGDVLKPTANRTSIILDAPKLVIAVFEREEFELLARSELSTVGSGADRTSGRQSSVTLSMSAPRHYEQGGDTVIITPPPVDPPPTDDTPTGGNILVPGDSGGITVPGGTGGITVPGGGDGEVPIPGAGGEIPVPGTEEPIPEPATMAMLAAGTIFLRKKRSKNKMK